MRREKQLEVDVVRAAMAWNDAAKYTDDKPLTDNEEAHAYRLALELSHKCDVLAKHRKGETLEIRWRVSGDLAEDTDCFSSKVQAQKRMRELGHRDVFGTYKITKITQWKKVKV